MLGIYMAAEKALYDEECDKALSAKNRLSPYPEDWVECGESNLKIGDIVYVEYSPDSQKHLYTHYPEYGIVEEIGFDEYYSPNGDTVKKEIAITINNHDGQMVKLNKGHLSIYSRGYCMWIKKYELRRPRTPVIENYTDCMVCGRPNCDI
jgi:hypothetical protein